MFSKVSRWPRLCGSARVRHVPPPRLHGWGPSRDKEPAVANVGPHELRGLPEEERREALVGERGTRSV